MSHPMEGDMTPIEQDEAGRWYDAIHPLLHKFAPKANIDGSVAESGDLLESIKAELQQAHNHWENRASDALFEMGLEDESAAYGSSLEAVVMMFPNDNVEEGDPTRQQLTADRDQLTSALTELLTAIRCMDHSRESLGEPTETDCFNLITAKEEAAKLLKTLSK